MSAQPHKAQVPTAAVLAPDASVVAAQEGGVMRVWDRASGKRLAAIPNRSFFRGAVAQGALLGVVDEKPRVWRGPRFGQVVELRGMPKVLTMGRPVASADGRVAAATYPSDGGIGDPDALSVWDARSGALRGTVRVGKGERIVGVALSATGETLALLGDEKNTRALLRVYRLGRRAGGSAAGAPGAGRSDHGQGLEELLRWESKTERPIFSGALSPDGSRLAVGAGERILLWDLKARKLLGGTATAAAKALFPPAIRRARQVEVSAAHQLAFSPDGRRLASLHGVGILGVALWEVGGGRGATVPLTLKGWVRRGSGGATQRGLAFDGKGGLWLVSAGYGPEVTLHAAKGDEFVVEKTLLPD